MRRLTERNACGLALAAALTFGASPLAFAAPAPGWGSARSSLRAGATWTCARARA
jgi:hypothetical protein